MNINWNKTKDMWIGVNTNLSTNVLCLNDSRVERVYSFKLLGIMIEYDLKWSAHADLICAKASSRLYFLKILKRSLLATDDLLYLYMSAVCPLLEYACPVWHTSLTKEQSGQTEFIHKLAFRIIFNNNCMDYENFCRIHQLQTLADRHSELCRSL